MSVHSTYYENDDEYKRDLTFEYRREQYELDHGIGIPNWFEGDIEDEWEDENDDNL